MKKRILAVLLCLCLLAGLVPIGTTVFAADTTDYAIGDAVEFAGHYWYIIGTESKGEKAPSGCYTLFAKNNDFGDTNFGHKQTYQYMYSTLKEKMDEIAGSFSEEDKASIEAPDALDGVTEPLLWPLSLNQLRSISANMQQFEKDYYTRTATYDGANSCAYASFYRVSDGALSSCLSNETKAVRPALYVKAEALPETVMGIQVAFGGQWWYVVGEGKNGSVPGPENTVTLFENPQEIRSAPVVQAQTDTTSYLGSDLQQKMANFSSNLKLAGKESSLIVPRTLTSSDGISGQTASDQPFWPLSKDEADRTDSEILKSELYDDPLFIQHYWLRTTNDTTSWTTVYSVRGDTGKVVSDYATSNIGVRPAFYLDISDAFYLAKDAKRVTIGGDPYPLVLEGYEKYKYTIFDDSLKLYMTADPAQASQTGKTISFGYVANTGENQYLSCVLTPDGSTDVLYYNRLVELDDTAASGTVSVPLTGVSDGNYTLRLYTEQENNYSTDFASRTVNVKITVHNGVASIRDLGDIQLVGESEGGQDGEDGREVELKNDGTSILWRYVGEGDDAWRLLVDISDITGADGKQVELRVENGYIQWKYDADSEWQNLIALSALQGIKGDKGDKGDPGEDGDTPYVGGNGNWWIGGIDTGIKAEGIDGSNGSQGKDGQDGKDGKDGKDGQDGKDGVGIADIKLSENGELIVTLTDGTEKNLGKIKGEDGASVSGVSINENGELIVTLSDGTKLNAGAVPTTAAEDSNLKTLVYVSVGIGGASLVGLIAVLAFLLTKRKKLI